MYLIIKNKSAWDVSYTGYVTAFIFAFCSLLYGLLKKEKQLIAVSVLLSFNSFGAVPDNRIKCYKVWDEKESIK